MIKTFLRSNNIRSNNIFKRTFVNNNSLNNNTITDFHHIKLFVGSAKSTCTPVM